MASVLEQPLPNTGISAEVAHERQHATGSNRPVDPPAANTLAGLPNKFIRGVAISVFQNSGGRNSNWGRFCEAAGKFFGLFPNIMDRSNPNDGACGFWEEFEGDIKLAKQAGSTGFRFSIEWHRIEPKEGEIDRAAVATYHKMIDAISAEGMLPNATLHHFVHPDWWDAKGGFEKEENVPAFIRFCELCAKEFGGKVKMWSTFNEPTCALVCGWLIGVHPPGKMFQFWLMGKVLKNKLTAHARAYETMKALPGCSDLQIGLVHHHVEFMPYRPWYFWMRPIAWWATFWWGRDTVLGFLQTGKFEWWVPLWGKTISYQETSKVGLDWFGVNYYSRGILGPLLNPIFPKCEVKTDMGYTLFSTGLYENLVRGSALGVPMYVSEIGAADHSEDDHIRIVHVKSHMRQIFKAVRDGFDVRGIFYWTLMDNFEWNTGYTMKFGIYNWDSKDPTARSLKPGGKVLVEMYNDLPEDMDALRQKCQTAADMVDDYEMEVRRAQANARIWPVVWHHQQTKSVPPLSDLHLKIGFGPDRLPEGEEQVPEASDIKYASIGRPNLRLKAHHA